MALFKKDVFATENKKANWFRTFFSKSDCTPREKGHQNNNLLMMELGGKWGPSNGAFLEHMGM